MYAARRMHLSRCKVIRRAKGLRAWRGMWPQQRPQPPALSYVQPNGSTSVKLLLCASSHKRYATRTRCIATSQPYVLSRVKLEIGSSYAGEAVTSQAHLSCSKAVWLSGYHEPLLHSHMS